MVPEVLHSDESSEYYFAEGCYILELSNSRHDAGLSVARARVLPGTTTRLHALQDTWERYVILEGIGLVDVGEQERQQVTAGSVVVIPPDCPQRISNSGDQDLVFLALCTPRFNPACYRDLES